MKMRPVLYDWKDPAARGRPRQVGLIAQELQKIVPELVDEDSSTGMLSVQYPALAPVLIEAIQDQQRTIEAQHSQLQKLEARIEQLEQQPRLAAVSASAFGVGGAKGALWFALGALPFALVFALRKPH